MEGPPPHFEPFYALNVIDLEMPGLEEDNYVPDDEISLLIKDGNAQKAILLITAENVNLGRSKGSLLKQYSENDSCPDIPEFVHHLFNVGIFLYDGDDGIFYLRECWHTHKPNSARALLEIHPEWFSCELYDEMCVTECEEGAIQMLDMGFDLDWYHTTRYSYDLNDAMLFHFARNRARKRAMILLGLPRLRRGSESGGAKRDVYRIIARVIWSLRRFN